MGQKDISSFFAKPNKPAVAAAAKKDDPIQPAKAAAAPAAAARKRLKRTVSDSPAKSKQNDAALEDEVDIVAGQEVAGAPAAPAAVTPPPPASASKAGSGVAGAATRPAAPASPARASPQEQAGPSGSGTPQAATSDDKKSPTRKNAAPAAAGASQDQPADVVGSMMAASAALSAAAKKRAKTAPAAKVDGVGSGALTAAAEHANVDVATLATWGADKPVPYAFLADTFEMITTTTKRLSITNMLIGCFRAILSTTPEDLLPAVYMCVNRVSPPHEGLELGLGEATLIKALAASAGTTDAAVKKEYERVGDLGTLAVSLRSTQKTMFPLPPLTIRGVFKSFHDIATTSGAKSQDRKLQMISKLLAAAKGNEPGYIMRSLQAKLRIGLAEQSVLVALAHAVHLHKEEAQPGADPGSLAGRLSATEQLVKAAYSECPSYDVLIPALLAHPATELLEHCHFMPGVPIRPMLAKATNGVAEVLEKFSGQAFTCEYKYDGERAQIHVLDDGSVRIFSRSAENNTTKYPDVIERMPALLGEGVKSLVFDAEAVAWDVEKKRILPFQILSTRARKDVKTADVKVQVCIFAFDLLYLNGESYLGRPLTERREQLYKSLKEQEGKLQFALEKTSTDVEELEVFLNDSVEHGTEGLIVKTLNDTYEPAKRSSHWLKLKKDYLEGVGDTFDVVPIGAFYGRGKRAGVYGAYLLAVYDDENERYQTISKLGTGFSEEQLTELANLLRPHVIAKPPDFYMWGENVTPDVWFSPQVVWEVKAADLSISPVHRAATGLVDADKGISIRFPRLMRVRDDKKPQDATTADQVAEMYRRQAVVRGNKKAEVDEDAMDE